MKITEKKYFRLKFFEWISLAINVILSYILISLGNGESISPLWIILGLFIAGQGLFKVHRVKLSKDFSIIGLLIDCICVLILSAICILAILINTSSFLLTTIMLSFVIIEIIIYLLMVFGYKIFKF